MSNKKCAIFFADGLEEIEGLTVVDMLRRAEVDIDIVSVSGSKAITGSHKIRIEADRLFEEIDPLGYDMLILPGGMPGTKNLTEHAALGAALKDATAEGRYLAAICAAPSVLGQLGLLEGKHATSYPGWDAKMPGCIYETQSVVTDGNITTSRGMGTALAFAARLADILKGEGTGQKLLDSVMYPI